LKYPFRGILISKFVLLSFVETQQRGLFGWIQVERKHQTGGKSINLN